MESAASQATSGARNACLSLSPAAYWPMGVVEAFALRMAGHGHSVSRGMMVGDRRYALDQLEHAHTLADDRLHRLAMELFRHYERVPGG